MAEPELTQEEKQEWIDLFTIFLNCLNNDCDYNEFRKFFYCPNCNFNLPCKLRKNSCDLMCRQNELENYNCNICWVNWFLHDYKGLSDPDASDIFAIFKSIDANQLLKIIQYKCYCLEFEAIKEEDKNIFITYIQNAIDYLSE